MLFSHVPGVHVGAADRLERVAGLYERGGNKEVSDQVVWLFRDNTYHHLLRPLFAVVPSSLLLTRRRWVQKVRSAWAKGLRPSTVGRGMNPLRSFSLFFLISVVGGSVNE